VLPLPTTGAATRIVGKVQGLNRQAIDEIVVSPT
jgi:hypothetical protein